LETDVFELPVVRFHNATEEVMGATFVSINVNQKPVNRDLLTQMKAILGLLDTDIDKACIDLIHDLDDDLTSAPAQADSSLSKRKRQMDQNKSAAASRQAPALAWRCTA